MDGFVNVCMCVYVCVCLCIIIRHLLDAGKAWMGVPCLVVLRS
jgi:hypothetical protein